MCHTDPAWDLDGDLLGDLAGDLGGLEVMPDLGMGALKGCSTWTCPTSLPQEVPASHHLVRPSP